MNGVLLPVIIENVASRRDNTIKITLGCQELSSGKVGELFQLHNKVGYCYISPKTVSQSEIDQVNELNPELQGKSPGQRLRNVLFVLWQQQPEGFKDFDTFYRNRIERIIEQIKEKLQP